MALKGKAVKKCLNCDTETYLTDYCTNCDGEYLYLDSLPPVVLNLTQHNVSPEQVEAGVVDLDSEDRVRVKELLTFDVIPTAQEMEVRAKELAHLARHQMATATRPDHVMIGGAPFFMSTLERVLKENNLNPVYAFTKRVAVEKEDGTKTSIFKHEGFVE